MADRVPYRPGPVGRAVRVVLGVLVLQLAVSTGLSLVDGVSGGPDPANPSLWAAVGVAGWLTPVVFDVGLGQSFGSAWRVGVAAGVVGAAAIGAFADAAGTGVSYWLLSWITLTMGWLGLSFVAAAALATPGCEMRSLAHLRALLSRGDRDFAPCPGPLQRLDEWESQTSGRARPYQRS